MPGKGLEEEAVAVIEARRHPRFKIEVAIRVYPRNSAVLRGHTVDISESGISAMLRDEVPIGEVVRLEFALPAGSVEIHGVARQRNAFRYGFEFLEAISQLEIVRRTCRQLSVEEVTAGFTGS
jgi:c-di-GMP-binding flagellar brake protein YcgR